MYVNHEQKIEISEADAKIKEYFLPTPNLSIPLGHKLTTLKIVPWT